MNNIDRRSFMSSTIGIGLASMLVPVLKILPKEPIKRFKDGRYLTADDLNAIVDRINGG